MSNKQQIEESLKSLILDDDKEFVAMLSGEWGIGKTYFWKDFSKKYLKDKDVVYISLFGKNALADIETEVVTKLYKYNKGLKKYTRHLDTVGNMASKAMGLPINISIGSLLSLFKASDFKNTIICFDDFERLSDKVPLKDVMGLISQFKEQKECKVIMILNEKELDKLSDIDGKKHDEIFALYKEKVVDYNFHYQPSQDELSEAIKTDIDKITFCEHLTIYDFFKKIDLKNIRIMKQALYLLSKFDFIEDNGFSKPVIAEFIELSLLFFITKIKYNISYQKFLDYEEARNTSDPLSLENKENTDNTYKKISLLYQEIPYSNTKDDTLHILNEYAGRHIIKKESLISILKENNVFFDKNNIRDKIFQYYNKARHDFKSNVEHCAKEIFNLLKANENHLIHIFTPDNLATYFKLIEEYTISSKAQQLKKTILKSYIIHSNKTRGTISSNVLKELYPNSIFYIEKVIEEKNKEIKNNITIKQLLDFLEKVQSGWSPNDIFILTSIDSQTYVQYIEESSEFYLVTIDFLSHHRNTNDFSIPIKNLKIALLQLKEKNSDNAWRINKILTAKNINLADKE